MTVPEFKAWLSGYMQDRDEPSLDVIVAKVAELDESAPTPFCVPSVWFPQNPTVPYSPWGTTICNDVTEFTYTQEKN